MGTYVQVHVLHAQEHDVAWLDGDALFRAEGDRVRPLRDPHQARHLRPQLCQTNRSACALPPSLTVICASWMYPSSNACCAGSSLSACASRTISACFAARASSMYKSTTRATVTELAIDSPSRPARNAWYGLRASAGHTRLETAPSSCAMGCCIQHGRKTVVSVTFGGTRERRITYHEADVLGILRDDLLERQHDGERGVLKRPGALGDDVHRATREDERERVVQLLLYEQAVRLRLRLQGHAHLRRPRRPFDSPAGVLQEKKG